MATPLLCVSLQAFVVVGDSNGHLGLGVKCAKEVGHVFKHPSCMHACMPSTRTGAVCVPAARMRS